MRHPAAAAAVVVLGLVLVSAALYHGLFRIATEPGGNPPQEAAAGPVLAAGPAAPVAEPVVAVTDEDRRRAVEHWNAGIIYFQKSDLEKARDHWLLCRQLDAGNSDCAVGLERIDKAQGPSRRGPGSGEK